jgi:anti-sigma regulatory factor (Ser/Thr protein kinase)
LTTPGTDPLHPHAPISVHIPGGAGAPSNARRSVLSQLGGQLAGPQANDAALLVSELVTNSVLHANVGPEQTLVVELLRIDDRLRITVIDPGSHLEPILQEADHRTPGGFGLFLVDRLAAAWGVGRDGTGPTRVWCELAIEEA